MENENLGVDSLEPEEYFKEVLLENSKDFLMLKRLVEESRGKISWDKLKEYTVVKDKKVEWIYREGELDLSWTSISTLWKLKIVRWKLSLFWVKTLEDLWELEEVWWYLDLRWTSVDVQLEVIRKINNWELQVEGKIYFWWDIDGIERLLEEGNIPWKLSLFWVETLEDLWELEEVWWYLYLNWTRIRSLWKLKRVWWELNLRLVGTLKDLWELEEVWWDLDLSWTSIENLWKLKRVWWKLHVGWVKTLEDLWELEEVWWYLYLGWTRIRSLWKLKRVWWKLDLEWVETLEDLWKLEEVWWDLNLRWTSVDVQLEAIRKINRWELRVEGKIYFWWDIDGIERLLEEGNIPWNLYLEWVKTLRDLWELEEVWWDLDLSWTSIENLWKLKRVWWYLNLSWVKTLRDLWKLEEVWWDLDLGWTSIESLWELKRVWWNLELRWTRIEVQLEAWKKIKEWKLIVEWKFLCHYGEYFEELIGDDWEINFGNLESKYWNNVDNIGDEEIKGIIIEILTWWLWYKKRELTKEIAEIIGEEGLSEEEKIKAISELNRKYEELKQKLKWYGISLDK